MRADKSASSAALRWLRYDDEASHGLDALGCEERPTLTTKPMWGALIQRRVSRAMPTCP
jgi:hypothetical protein